MSRRYAFGGGEADVAFIAGDGNAAILSGGAAITFWDSQISGTQYTDIATDPVGTPYGNVTTSTGTASEAIGQIPVLYGPVGITKMWAEADGGPRALLLATDLDDDVLDLQAGSALMRPVVPLYQYPSFAGSGWDDLAVTPYGIAIANPADGPGASTNSDWEREINAARAAGMKVVGYVTTDSSGLGGDTAGSRTAADVKADVDAWYTLYAVDGIFFDLTPTGIQVTPASYVDEICDHVRTKGVAQLAIINPGTYPLTADFVAAADIACVYEGDYTVDPNYLEFAIPGYASWVGEFAATKYLHLVYAVPDLAAARAVARHAQSLGVAWVYAASSNSAWTTLPSYWADQVTVLRGLRPMLDPLDRRNHHGPVVEHSLAVAGARNAPEGALANLLVALERLGVITDDTTAI